MVNMYRYCDVSTLHVLSPKLSKVFVLRLILIVCCEIRRSNIISLLRCRFSMISGLHMSQSDTNFNCAHVTVNLCSYKMCTVFVGGGGLVMKKCGRKCKLHTVLTLVLDRGQKLDSRPGHFT